MNMRGPMYQYYSEQLSDEEAKEIGNYTVYGMGDPRIFKNIVPIKKHHVTMISVINVNVVMSLMVSFIQMF